MVPLSERRHRLYPHEIPEVIAGLKLRIAQLCVTKDDKEKAEIAFRTLYRLVRKESGRPRYPLFSWQLIENYSTYQEEQASES